MDDGTTLALLGSGLATAFLVGGWLFLRRWTVPVAPPDSRPAEEAKKEVTAEPGLTQRLRGQMSRTREVLQGRLITLFGRPLDESTFDELEELLLSSDVGLQTVEGLLKDLRSVASREDCEPPQLYAHLREQIRTILSINTLEFTAPKNESIWVIMLVGVNGSGKTTTVGKLAASLKDNGYKVLLAAADTYRAAAAEQLTVWAERVGVDIVAQKAGADPGAVVYSALEAAKARGHDVVLIDTAGRLQTRKPLMQQLEKMRGVVGKHVPTGPHQTLLVVDGTMGQNALSQARLFNEATPLSGVVVTKLDGTAKGGMVITLASEMKLPIKFIGIGEKTGDLRPFEANAYVDALI